MKNKQGLFSKILCKLGFHYWGYQSKATGVYLHTFYNGILPRGDQYYTEWRKCWECDKKEVWKK